MTDPAQAQLDAYNARDIDAFMACYTPDVRIEDGEGTLIADGAAAVRERYMTIFTDYPQLHCQLRSRIRVGNYVLDEEHITGRGDQPLHVVAIYHIHDGLINHVRLVR
ncbi:nuclear transport factor 2 family protein [Parachitinimonas caeni]|uniref:Nuclear transport factor 2 family protein n=1 Tax=Parachitinimonas caeni TaxID=3031301 RepID=A0ABT7DUU8_9NEIS|nr:nuclear transport factor 2 family protein [Parachitinimonas caeni]MDK2123846.1 nuclear transport factor 2 family protein [Parachitinimonas caeni]